MHIVFLTNEYPKKNIAHGGIGTFVKFLANKLAVKGFTINVVGINSTFLDEFEEDNSIKIYRLKKSTWKFGKFIDQNKRVKKKINEINAIEKIDIIEGSELSFAFFSKKTSYIKLIRLHGGHHFFAKEQDKKINFWKGFQEKKSFKKADNYVAVSNYVGSKTREYLNYDFSFTTIFNGIDSGNFKIDDSVKETNYKLLYIGTVCKKKGIDILIQAITLLKKEFPKISLDIVGRDWYFNNGTSYINYLKETIINKNIKNNVQFLGVKPYKELPKLIQSSQICVFPSIAESFGLTLIEAMSIGKPIVASNIAPYKEIVADSNSVVFFNKNSIEDISNKIFKLLHNKKEREKLKLKSKAHIFKMFNAENVVNKNIEFYKSII